MSPCIQQQHSRVKKNVTDIAGARYLYYEITGIVKAHQRKTP